MGGRGSVALLTPAAQSPVLASLGGPLPGENPRECVSSGPLTRTATVWFFSGCVRTLRRRAHDDRDAEYRPAGFVAQGGAGAGYRFLARRGAGADAGPDGSGGERAPERRAA